jgi:type III pantothenate kinase
VGKGGIDPEEVDAISMCSVVPPITDAIRRALVALFGQEPLQVGKGTRTGISIQYDRPQDVGTDRIADAVAAFNLYGGPAVVVDLGTATVFDAISNKGEYLGGALSPGVNLAADALYQATSLLRRVDLEAPANVIGRDTTSALQSGLLYGNVGLVEGMVARFTAELSPDDPASVQVIATGGLAPTIAAQTDAFTIVNEDLTLIGLRIIYELNV